jgi:hypothetical protein
VFVSGRSKLVLAAGVFSDADGWDNLRVDSGRSGRNNKGGKRYLPVSI